MYSDFRFYALAFASLVTANIARDTPNERATITQSSIPKSVITPPPEFHGGLYKRALATCGYVRGNSASPLTCLEGYNCITTAKVQPVFACCNNIECLDNWGICEDYGQNSNCLGFDIPADACSSIYGSILQCSQEAPKCFRYARSSALGASTTFYSYACGTTSSDILVLETATNAVNQDPTPTPTDADAGPFPSIPGLSVAPPASTSTSSGGHDSGPAKGTRISTTAIVSIVLVGGSALFVTVGFACWYVWQRRQRNSNNVHRPSMPPPHFQPPPPPANGPGPGPFNFWNNSVPVGAQARAVPHSPLARERSGQQCYEMGGPARPLHELPGT